MVIELFRGEAMVFTNAKTPPLKEALLFVKVTD
jgi:hypothetical protein